LINTNSSAALNGVGGAVMSSASKLQGLASGGLAGATDLLSSAEKLGGQLKAEGASLVPSVTSILPKGLGNELQSAVKAIASSNPDKIKIPVVAENTVKRDSVDSQISSIISNPKVPPPEYGGDVQQDIQTGEESLLTYKEKLKDQKARFNTQFAVATQAKKAYQDAANSLPAGDPKLLELKNKFEEEYKKALEISAEIA
jgi:hypothetical protein